MDTLSIEQLEKDIMTFEKEIEHYRETLKQRKAILSEFRRALKQAKIEKRREESQLKTKHWPKEKQVEAVKRFFTEYGLIPTRKDFMRIEWLPNPSTVFRHWGPIAALREAAGLPGGLKGRGGAGRGGGWTPQKQRKPFEVTK